MAIRLYRRIGYWVLVILLKYNVWRLRFADGSGCTLISPEWRTADEMRAVIPGLFIGYAVLDFWPNGERDG